ncbi:hypothetical protein F5Y19DRAFT_490674 [Xylariaceae sp. FL1651]|nr:hypothetical protein F5Y19DRAFT_490674 [Xylariaceae sp. FL1651]
MLTNQQDFGLTLGGGLSRFMTEFSSGNPVPVGQLAPLNLVLVEGDFVNVTRTSHFGLFWALGSAGPNFGVIDSFTIQLMSCQIRAFEVPSLLFRELA